MYETYRDLAKQVRKDCLIMTNVGKSGHIGSMLSAADIMAVLYGGGLSETIPKTLKTKAATALSFPRGTQAPLYTPRSVSLVTSRRIGCIPITATTAS